MRRGLPRTVLMSADSPPIVCLCGSTKFKQEFIQAAFDFTLKGHIVLTVGWFSHADKDVFYPTEEQKMEFDLLHLHKIDLADFVFVVNVRGYIGDSTAREIAYAKNHGKPVHYLEDQKNG